MCLAIPVKVIETRGGTDALLDPPVAVVDTEGVRQKVRLDLVDRMPKPGDYLVVHAGFAINCLDQQEARKNLELMNEMAGQVGKAADIS